MLRGAFKTTPQDIKLNTTGVLNSSAPLTVSANPFQPSGLPLGLVARDGDVYTSVPDSMPIFVVYPNGSAELRTRYTVDTLKRASFVVSGGAMLLQEGLRTDETSCMDTMRDAEINRVGIGIDYNNQVTVLVTKGTLDELIDLFELLDVPDAMMLSYNNVYVNYVRGGLQEGVVLPLALLEVNQMAELARPIVVIDPGHGGKDPGSCASGLQEKTLNLAGARIVQSYLKANFQGTFILTRDNDATVELDDRAVKAVSLKADLFVSLHINASAEANKGTGFETVCMPTPLPASDRMRTVIHSHVTTYTNSHGLRDRGLKYANLQVLRDTQKKGIPGVLIETAFINNQSDAILLRDATFFTGVYKYIAEGIASAVGAKRVVQAAPKVTPTPTKQTLYRVQVGSYQFRKGAEDLQLALKKAGFEGIIVEDGGD